MQPKVEDTIFLLDLGKVAPGQEIKNHRKKFSVASIQELAWSIAEHGLLQAINVRPATAEAPPGVEYEIYAGERRWRAHLYYTDKVLRGKWDESSKCKPGFIKATIADIDAETAEDLMAVENLSRVDLTITEEARVYLRMQERDRTLGEISDKTGKPKRYISKLIRLLSLCEEVLFLLDNDGMTLDQAHQLNVMKLEKGRQLMVVKFLAKTDSPSWTHYKRYVNELAIAQADEMQTVFEFWSKPATEGDARFVTNGRDAVYSYAVDPALRDSDWTEYLPGTTVGSTCERYLAWLDQEGHGREYLAVSTLYEWLVRNAHASLPPPTALNMNRSRK